jgi:hypothetical protein
LSEAELNTSVVIYGLTDKMDEQVVQTQIHRLTSTILDARIFCLSIAADMENGNMP